MEIPKRPLDGVIVLDFTRVYSGPYCTLMLADLGAEVIKIERKDTGDDARQFLPLHSPERESGYFMYLNRNKKSIELDLKDPRAREIIYRLCGKADMVVENFSPGVADKLGIGYAEIKKHNPAIIYGSISGFGQTGPYKSMPAYDVIVQAMGGYMAISGPAGGQPIKLGTSIGDAGAGIHMAFALAAALYCREKTGVGQYVDVSMMDSVFSTLENFVIMHTFGGKTPTRNGNNNLGCAPFNVFKSSDSYVAIAAANNSLFEKFCNAVGRLDLLADPRLKDNKGRKENEAYLNGIVEEWTLQRTTAEVCAVMEKAKVPVGPLLGIDELVDDPQILARDMMVEVEHPTEGTFRMPGNPLKFSETPVNSFIPSPLLGENTAAVLEKYGSYTQTEIADLRESGVIFQ